MKQLTLLLFLVLYSLLASAVPAKRERYTLKLSNGSTIVATSMGDETMHFYQTDDGRCLQCDSLGIAHFLEPDSLYNRWQVRAAKRQTARDRRNAARRQKARAAMTGSKPGLVILVQFPDVPFYYDNDRFQRFFNEENYSDATNSGSVRDFFLDASYGQFDFYFDVVGPVTVSHNLSYYGANKSNGEDIRPATMVEEAIHLVDDEVDFSKYDWDGDGEVEHIFVIHSGYDEAQNTYYKNNIWSHAWTLSEAKDEDDGNGAVLADGVIVDGYATSSELRNGSGTNLVGIGTACHEFSHCFGLPDFYDTEGTCFGMNSWDLMDYGSYNNDGGTPAGFTSYERMFCGWLDPIELDEPLAVSDMPALTTEPVAYILRNTGKHDEYLLLENRQKVSWDKYLGGHGMLVLHVDYDSEAWYENTVNTVRSHQRMTIIPADNSLYQGSLGGDPWPGTSKKKVLSDDTSSYAKFFNNNAEGNKRINHSFTEITETTDGYISFIFDEEALAINPATAHTDAAVYDLQGRKVNVQMENIQMVNGKWLNGKCPGIYIQDGKKLLIR